MNRRTFLVTLGLATSTIAVAACSPAATRRPIELATDKPTLIYFYTPN